MTDDKQPEEGLMHKVGEGIAKAYDATGLHKVVDATILDKSPHGTNVDGVIDAGPALHKVVDATVLDKSPHGTNVDHAINIEHHTSKPE